MLFIFLKVLVVRTKPTLVKQKDIWQLGLGSIFLEIQPFFNIYPLATHVIIPPLRIFIFCHMVAMILMIKQNRLRTSRNKNLFQKTPAPTWCIIFAQCIIIIIKLIFNCNMTYNHIYQLSMIAFLLAYLCSIKFWYLYSLVS